ncbi:hypothetical protein ONE63_011334 [Megalurothrips usitatus]|uniref:Uncharacterized protein n=1 Tax=Megalurothrips usitatus TaxID=439358 RepID=A0AAV7X381_9NEOP|nr:hypothetical protein ONE63_011334 [Megalurothrips usitatus]
MRTSVKSDDGRTHRWYGLVSRIAATKNDLKNGKRSIWPREQNYKDIVERNYSDMDLGLDKPEFQKAKEAAKETEKARMSANVAMIEKYISKQGLPLSTPAVEPSDSLERKVKQLEEQLAKERKKAEQERKKAEQERKKAEEQKRRFDRELRQALETKQREDLSHPSAPLDYQNLVQNISQNISEMEKRLDEKIAQQLSEVKTEVARMISSVKEDLSSRATSSVASADAEKVHLCDDIFISGPELRSLGEMVGTDSDWANRLLSVSFTHPEDYRLNRKQGKKQFPKNFLRKAKDLYAQWKEFRGVPKEAWQEDYEKLPAYLARLASNFGGGAVRGLEANLRLGLRAGKTPEEIVQGLSPKLRERWAARQEAVQQPTAGQAAAGDGPTPPKQKRAYQRRGELRPPAARALNTARDENRDPEGDWGLAAGGRAPSPLAAQLAHPAPLRLHLGPQLPVPEQPATVLPGATLPAPGLHATALPATALPAPDPSSDDRVESLRALRQAETILTPRV